MRHRKFTFKIGRKSAHRRSDMANMTCSLLAHGEVKTTVARAKQLRRIADKMITLGKRGTLHARRQAVAKLKQKPVVKVLFDEIAPRYAERPGGYTRILRLGQRVGDASDMCLVQLVQEPYEPNTEQVGAPAEEEVVSAAESESGAAEEAAVEEEAADAEAAETADEAATEEATEEPVEADEEAETDEEADEEK